MFFTSFEGMFMHLRFRSSKSIRCLISNSLVILQAIRELQSGTAGFRTVLRHEA